MAEAEVSVRGSPPPDPDPVHGAPPEDVARDEAGSDSSGESTVPTHASVPALLRRYAILGPILLVTVQVLVDYLHLQLPTSLVIHNGPNPTAYHQFLSSKGAFSDLYTLYWQHHLYAHPLPYLDVRIEYPVVMGLYMTAAAAVTHGVRTYFTLSSLGLYACTVGSVCCLWSVSKRAAWIFAICPMLLVFSLLNWDMLAIFFMLLGWRAWSRAKYTEAAVWLTLGTFTKLYPVFLLIFCAADLIRRRRSRELARGVVPRYVIAAAVVTAVVNVPFLVLAPKNWEYFFTFNSHRNTHVSIVYWLHVLSPNGSDSVANLVFEGVVALAVIAGTYAVLRGVAPARAAAVAFAVFLLMQKVYSPQYTLWLIPFALLAGWQFWSIATLSMVGLGNYISAATAIYLRLHDRVASTWFARNVEPLNRDVRLAVILAVTLAAIATPIVTKRLAESPGLRDSPAARAT